jgi:hypothetical protein
MQSHVGEWLSDHFRGGGQPRLGSKAPPAQFFTKGDLTSDLGRLKYRQFRRNLPACSGRKSLDRTYEFDPADANPREE